MDQYSFKQLFEKNHYSAQSGIHQLISDLKKEIDKSYGLISNRLQISLFISRLNKLASELENKNTTVEDISFLEKEGFSALLKIHNQLYQVSLANLFYGLSILKLCRARITKDSSDFTLSTVYSMYSLSILDDVNNLFSSQAKGICSESITMMKNQNYELIAKIYSNLLKNFGLEDSIKINSHELDNISKRKILEKIRKNVSDKIKDITNLRLKGEQCDYNNEAHKLFQKINTSMIEYLSALFHNAESVMGIPPCKYAVSGMGSISSYQITPYSDLEFFIVTENDNYRTSSNINIVNYFKNLCHLVHFYNICLGETAIPEDIFNINLDKYIKCAVQFDLGGKTPLGRSDKKYELIQTVDKMLDYFCNVSIQNSDKNLLNNLEKTSYVYGEILLVEQYEKLLDQLMTQPSDKIDTLTKAQYRAYRVLRKGIKGEVCSNYLEEFSPNKNITSISGKLFNVKQEIYRTPDRFLNNLGKILKVKANNNWTLIDELYKSHKITATGAINLKSAFSFANLLRVQTYDYYQCQKESLSSKNIKYSILDKNYSKLELSKIFQLEQSEINIDGPLFRFFYTMRALHKKLSNYCIDLKEYENKQLPDTNPVLINDLNIKTDLFCDDRESHKIQICNRLMQWQQSIILGEKNLHFPYNDNELLTIKHGLVTAYEYLGNYQKALQYQLNILKQVQKNKYKINNILLASSLNNIGHTYGKLAKYQEALKYFKKSITINQETLTCQSIFTSTTLNNIGYIFNMTGKHKKALKYQIKALKIRQNISDYDNNLDIASSYHNIGSTYEKLSSYLSSLPYKLKALKIRKQLLGDEHPDIALNLNNIGFTYLKLEEYHLALKYTINSLKIRKSVIIGDHPELASSYFNIGYIYGKLFNFDKALHHLIRAVKIDPKYEKALSIMQCRQKKFLNSVEIYNEYGKRSKNGHQKHSSINAIKELKSALKIFKELNHYYFTISTLQKLILLFNESNLIDYKEKYEKRLFSELQKFVKRKKVYQDARKIEKSLNLLDSLSDIIKDDDLKITSLTKKICDFIKNSQEKLEKHGHFNNENIVPNKQISRKFSDDSTMSLLALSPTGPSSQNQLNTTPPLSSTGLFSLQHNDILSQGAVSNSQNKLLPSKRKLPSNCQKTPCKIMKRSISHEIDTTLLLQNEKLLNFDFLHSTTSPNSTSDSSSQDLIGQDINYTQ